MTLLLALRAALGSLSLAPAAANELLVDFIVTAATAAGSLLLALQPSTATIHHPKCFFIVRLLYRRRSTDERLSRERGTAFALTPSVSGCSDAALPSLLQSGVSNSECDRLCTVTKGFNKAVSCDSNHWHVHC
jgi:hypothetical protein